MSDELKTIKVKIGEDDAVINAEDFDPKIHKREGEKPSKKFNKPRKK